MAQTYTRQSSFADGDTITAALFNNEYNQLVNAFAYSSSSASSTGHRHDGTAGQGGNIHTIGDLDFLNKIVVDSTNNRWGFYVEVSSSAVEQIRLQDGALLPVTDSDVDLGTSSLYFKDAYIDSITTTGNVAVGGNLTVTGTTTFNGGTLTLGDSAADNVVFGADVDSHIIPDDDDTYDLGSSTQQWRNLYVDGTANLDVVDIDGAVDFASTTAHAGNASFADNAKAIFGAGSDLQIYHDGSNSIVQEVGTGDLRLAGNVVRIRNSADTENMISAVQDGAVTICYDGNSKLATTSTGIDVTGTAVTDGLTSSGDLVVDDGTRSLTYDVSAGELNHAGSNFYINKTNGVDVSIGNDDFYVDMSTSRVGIGTTSPDNNIHIYDASGGATLKIESNTSNAYDSSKIQLLGGNLSTSEILLGDASSATVGRIIYRHDGNSLAFDVNGSEAVRIDSSGNLVFPGDVTLDSAGNISLDADGGYLFLKDGGTTFGQLRNESTDFSIKSITQDKDLIFKGNDGGSEITALTLDMSDAGKATFNNAVIASGISQFADVNIPDNNAIRFGNSQDLQFYHDGTNSSIQNATGELFIYGGTDEIRIRAKNDEESIVATPNGAVTVYYDGSAKLATTTGGIQVTGDISNASGDFTLDVAGDINLDADDGTFRFRDGGTNLLSMYDSSGFTLQTSTNNGDLHFKGVDDSSIINALTLDMSDAGTAIFNHDITLPDSGQAIFGAGSDLLIYHDGSNSYVKENGTGALVLQSNGTAIVLEKTDGENMILANTDGAVTVYYDGSAKLATTSSGIDVTGTVELDNITVSGAQGSDGQVLTSTGSGIAWEDASGGASSITFKSEGTDFTGSLIVGHNTTGTLDAATDNTALGLEALDAITSGDHNTAVGKSSLSANTTGSFNTGIGKVALLANTTATQNTAVGAYSSDAITTGSSNTAVGAFSLSELTTGNRNTALGQAALDATTTGDDNTAVGKDALSANTTADNNTAVGKSALAANTTGANNVGVGAYALNENTTGELNTAVGKNSLGANTTGSYNTSFGGLAADALTTGSQNVAIGHAALGSDTKGSKSIAIGESALFTQNFTSATDTYNVAIGENAGTLVTTGQYNTLVGGLSGDAQTTADHNVALGVSTLTSNTQANKNVAIGSNALGTFNVTSDTDTYNVAVGYAAGGAITTGTGNTLIGGLAGDAITTAVNNTAVGYFSLTENTTGTRNTAVGTTSLLYNTTANDNTAVGYDSARATTTGTQNVAIGAYAFDANTTGSYNTAVGRAALSANTTADYNTAIGYQALDLNTTGANNTAVGAAALDANTTASNNTAVGQHALGVNTTGSSNTAVGQASLSSNTTASSNTALGYHSLYVNTTGEDNTAVGESALDANTTASGNTGMGANALGANTTGANNTAVGKLSLSSNTTASNNTAVGKSSLGSNTVGAYNTAVGLSALSDDTQGSKSTAIGYQALSTQNFTSATDSNNTAVGYNAGSLITTGANNTVVGTDALDANTTGGGNTAVGFRALTANTTASNNNSFGKDSLYANTTGAQNNAFGLSALQNNTTGADNTAVGHVALFANTTGGQNTAIGRNALDANTTASNNTAVGYNALTANTLGSSNTAVGTGSSLNNTTGSNNSSFGLGALYNTTTADSNTGIGKDALYYNTTGASNTAVGDSALETNSTASNNTGIGFNALFANTTGAQNTAVGTEAGDAITTGSNNAALGYEALGKLTTGGDNIGVGRAAALDVTTASGNVAVGVEALENNSTGGNNVAVGKQALRGSSMTGAANTAVGVFAGYGMTSGGSNVAIGDAAGFALTSGGGNVIIGKDAGRTGSPGGNQTTGNNAIALGDENIGAAHIQVDWTVASDERDKTDFTALDLGLNFVNALEPFTYKWDKRSKYGNKNADDYDLNAQTPDGTHKEDWLDIGFKAQAVLALEEAAGYTIANKKNLTVSLTEDEKSYGLQYTKFIPILVKALQEADDKIDALTARIEALES